MMRYIVLVKEKVFIVSGYFGFSRTAEISGVYSTKEEAEEAMKNEEESEPWVEEHTIRAVLSKDRS